MRLRQDVFQEAQLVQEVDGAGLEHLPAELAIERFVPFQHQDVGASLGEKEAEHQPGRPSTHDARAHARAGHGTPHAPPRYTMSGHGQDDLAARPPRLQRRERCLTPVADPQVERIHPGGPDSSKHLVRTDLWHGQLPQTPGITKAVGLP